LIVNDIFGFYNAKNFFKFFLLLFYCTILIFSSFQINDNFSDKANAQSCTDNLPVSGVTASGNDGNVPQNVLDNSLATKWSSFGIGQWIRADLGSIQNICSVDIAWTSGNARQYHFVIATSTDGSTFTNKFSGDSSGTTLNSEKYVIPATDARYVRITVNGNTANNWASMTELDIFGTSSAPSGNYHYAPGLVLTGSNFQDVASSSTLQRSQFSVAAWFKTSTNFGSNAFIVNKGGTGSDSSGENMNYGIWMTSSEKIQAGFEAVGGADHFVTSTNTYNNGQWHYAVVTYGGSSVILYVDGVQVATKSTSGASPETSGTKPVRVGANSRVTPSANFFTGEVDEVRVWNDDLTTQQVADALAGSSFNTGEQVLYLPFTTSGAGTDIFGIKKLYPTKNNGEEWYINMNNPLGDSRFNPQNTITQNPDGSWKMKSTQVRMNVYTSTGYNSANIPTLDHSVIASKGYMLASNDWRNFEMTQYVKVNTSPSDDNFSPNGRGGRHTGSGAPEGCEGSSMKGDLFFSGKVRFAKEQWHVSYVFTSLKTPTGSIEDKWVGIKFIVYNFVENNKVVVKTELWLDTNNNGNFVKVDENVDRGGWGTEGVECGGAPDQIISWGGPITTFRWDTATDVDFKNLSVREIVPPQ
jgi:Concanavalin A-like lectin/glucanases superfamily/F5/8 type C domain